MYLYIDVCIYIYIYICRYVYVCVCDVAYKAHQPSQLQQRNFEMQAQFRDSIPFCAHVLSCVYVPLSLNVRWNVGACWMLVLFLLNNLCSCVVCSIPNRSLASSFLVDGEKLLLFSHSNHILSLSHSPSLCFFFSFFLLLFFAFLSYSGSHGKA